MAGLGSGGVSFRLEHVRFEMRGGIFQRFFAAALVLLLVPGPHTSGAQDVLRKEREITADRELWNVLQNNPVRFDSEESDAYFEGEAAEDGGEGGALLSLADRSLDEGSRDNRRPKLVLCQVVKVRRELGNAAVKYKPSVLENHVCRQSGIEFSDFLLDDILMQYSNRNLPVEFCVLHTSHAHHHFYKNCHTKTTQVSLFSRRFNSSEWSHESRKVAVGCGCEIGLKYYD